MDGTPVHNIFTPGAGTGAAIGGGLGAGLLGGVLGGALLGGNGLFGNRGTADGVNMNSNERVASLERLVTARFDAESQREIQAAVERTAGATQLAVGVGNAALGVEIAKGQGEANTQAALNAAALGVQVQKVGGDLATQVALNTAAVATAVERTGTASALAFKDTALQIAGAQYAVSQAIQVDGDKTRALIIANNDAALNRMLATAQNEIIELKGDRNSQRHSRETELTITQNVNQNQAQAQQQQQFQVLNTIASGLQALINQNQIIHNGIVNLGTMTASGNPVSSNTSVR